MYFTKKKKDIPIYVVGECLGWRYFQKNKIKFQHDISMHHKKLNGYV